MEYTTIQFEFLGREATVIQPEKPNGKWIWKTEFFREFDAAERALLDMGYTRVYFKVSNMYGSYKAVRLMHAFHLHLLKKLPFLQPKAVMFGFSRGGLYAFNYALFYSEYVEKIYLDAPVLDMRTWPWHGTELREQVYREYGLNEQTIQTFNGHPIENLDEFFAKNIPLLLIAGGADEVVPFVLNGGKLLDFARNNGISVTSIIKPDCAHHPHSLDDVTPIIDFVTK